MAVCAAYKQPLRGFSGLMVTAMAASCGARTVTTVGACAFLRRVQHRPRHTLRNPSSLVARVLNAFHDLHASMTTSSLPPAAVAAFLAGAGTSATALRFVVFLAIAFFGAIVFAGRAGLGSLSAGARSGAAFVLRPSFPKEPHVPAN